MKTKIFTFILSFACTGIYAQLTVNSSGNVLAPKTVSVGTTSVDTCVNLNIYRVSKGLKATYGLKSHVLTRSTLPTSSIYGLYGFSDATATTVVADSLRQVVGVFGKAFSSGSGANKFTAGVVGVATNSRGVGVYGTVTSTTNYSLPNGFETSSYAGYFYGNVKATGSVTAAAFPTSSDARLKTDIRNIDRSLSDRIMDLRPVSYKFNAEDTVHYAYPKDAKELQASHYGLIAQEVQEIFPDVVYDSGDGYLSINYIELIPMLIQTVQKQQQQIEELQSTLKTNSRVEVRRVSKTNTDAVLYQNTPNPFSKTTEIGYFLPERIKNAFIYIYDMSGTQIAGYSLTDKGEGTLTIDANTLAAGMYLYSLIADGQLIDTKQMILTK